MHHTDFIALDTETGGLNAAECALLSIAAVPSWDAPPFSVHILPVGRIDARAAEVNGYTEALWNERGAVTPKNALFAFQRWLFEIRGNRRFDMAAHNAGFDQPEEASELVDLAMEQQKPVGIVLLEAARELVRKRRGGRANPAPVEVAA